MTLISHQHKFIFLKTHKTASTSVEAAFEPLCLLPGDPASAHYRDMSVTEYGIVGARGSAFADRPWRNHMSARLVRRGVGRQIWRDYFKFSTVRNPFDRAVSMFHWRQSPEARQRLKIAPFEDVRAEFQNWLSLANLKKNRGKFTMGPVYVLNDVIRYENLEEDFARIARRFKMPIEDLPTYKAGQRRDDATWTAYYDNASRKIVERRCAFELAFFGYTFEGRTRTRSGFDKFISLATNDPVRIWPALRGPANSSNFQLDPPAPTPYLRPR